MTTNNVDARASHAPVTVGNEDDHSATRGGRDPVDHTPGRRRQPRRQLDRMHRRRAVDTHVDTTRRRPVLIDTHNHIAQLAGIVIRSPPVGTSTVVRAARGTMTQPDDPRKVKVIVELIDHTSDDRRRSTTAAIWSSAPGGGQGADHATRRSGW